MLTPPCHLVPNIFGNGFQEDMLHHLPRQRDEADWPVVPQMLCLVLLEDRMDISCLPGLRSVP